MQGSSLNKVQVCADSPGASRPWLQHGAGNSSDAAGGEAARTAGTNVKLACLHGQLARSLEVAELLPQLCRSAREFVGADGATFVLRDGGEVHYAAEDAIEPLWAGRRFPIDCCVSGWAILNERPAVIEDIYADERVPTAAYQSTFVRSMVMVPVRCSASLAAFGFPDPFAAMGVYWSRRRFATTHELMLLQALVDAAAVAFTNAQLYERMRAARLEAEAGSRAKDEFLAMLGHELRNPLAAVRSAIAVAQLDPNRGDKALAIARRQTDILTRMVDELLDVARITQGRITLKKEVIDLTTVLERALDAIRPPVEVKGQVLTVLLPRQPIRVEADAVRLEQVFVNLLKNANTYTDAGGQIGLTLDGEDGAAVIRVRDTGVGIPPEALPRIFEPFAQSVRPLDRAQGGLGLGLSLVKQLVEMHGGQVQAHSPGVGAGAEFLVRLPIVPAAGTESRAGEAVISKGPRRHRRILVVEDNADVAEALIMLLEALGQHVRVAHDGLAALEAVTRERPDLMLVDIGLPGMDGYELVQRLRALPHAARLPIVALTGYGLERERALAAGFDLHIVKPVEAVVLERLIEGLDGLGTDSGATPGAAVAG